jgi:glycosyltransferase involved in cell wall biosynthesis
VPDRPRLLIVITLAEVGGAQTYLAHLLPGLTEDFDVTVAAAPPGPLVAATEAAGARFVPLRRMRRELSPLDPLAAVELWRLMRRLRPQIVHANSSKAGVLARLAAVAARVPIRVFTVHGWAFKWYPGALGKAYLLADRLVRPLTTEVICVAESERKLGIAARTCTAQRTTMIANAVDVAAMPRAELAGEPPLLLSVGRLKAPKDFATLAQALARLDPGSVRVAIAGDGPDRAALEPLLPPGAILGERADIPQLLASADLFVLSSRSEGLPVAVIEAMAAGLPVIASRVGGVAELVEDGVSGLLVPPGDPEALAAAIRHVVADPEARRALGAAGRARAEELFDLERFREAHRALYRRLLQEGRAGE